MDMFSELNILTSFGISIFTGLIVIYYVRMFSGCYNGPSGPLCLPLFGTIWAHGLRLKPEKLLTLAE